MKFKFNYLAGLFFASIVILVSCSKEGPAGPAGAAGPQGANGANGAAGGAGAAGAAGATGATGTANIIYSPWLDVTFEPANADSSAWIAEIDAPKLVDSILNKGSIKVYLNAGSDSTNGQFVIPLPLYEPFLIGIIINPYFSNKLITLIASDDASSFVRRTYKRYQYRYILIPGGTPSGRGVKTIDWKDYKQVQAYLGLKD